MYVVLKILIFIFILNIHKINLKVCGYQQNVTNISITEEPTINLSEAPDDNLLKATEEIDQEKDFNLDAVEDASQETSNNINRREADLNSLFQKYDTDDGNTCFLDVIKQEILWWIHSNGTLQTSGTRYSSFKYLDLSHGNISDDLDLLFKAKYARALIYSGVHTFSAAYNKLNKAPFLTLASMSGSLKYLSLQGNNFAALTHDPEAIEKYLQETQCTPNCTQNKCDEYLANNDFDLFDRECLPYTQHPKNTDNPKHEMIYEDYIRKLQSLHKLFGTSKESIAWATFPELPHLLELDISNCSIEYLKKEAFENLRNLKKLFMSNNKVISIEADTFYHIQGLQYLDLSFTNVLNYNYQVSMPTLEVILNLVYGLKIYQTAFKMLPELIYLDLSHSKITRSSAVAFTHLGSKVKYLSLCYTSFPMISKGLFKNTILEGLDLSGNSFVSYNIVDDAFDGIGDTLKCLYFEHSNLKDLGWAKPLRKLQLLSLAGNNINALTSDIFETLESLQVLDLSSNHIGNWYRSVFQNNSDLRVLSLRSNNINMLTTEMLRDFEELEYLGLGNNNFICNCMLREVVEVAASNNNKAECSYKRLQHVAAEYLLSNSSLDQLADLYKTFMERKLWKNHFMPLLTESYKNIKNFKNLYNIIQMRFPSNDLLAITCPASVPKTVNDTTLKFQLLDYDATQYWCFNETDQIQVDELNCQNRMWIELESELHNTVMIVTAVIGSILGASILGFIIYLKRWHIHYYYASLKSAALLSRASKESLNKFYHLSEHDPNMIYDIFISYCQNDRQWVLDELLPNVEKSGDISICLHERDFQIGVTILDNIISCMDRSRSLMLLISSKFLLSHWCQFEMYLAQHRIFEVSKEHLILVFLEDIPRSKRPKTLQYLMDIKTYIKWPSKGEKQPSADERKFFWKRLRKSLELIGIGTEDSKA